MALPTPVYNLSNYPEVYEPSEDTFLFIDALEEDMEFIKDLNPRLAIEIGSGSGVVIAALAFIMGKSCAYFSTDVNFEACKATKTTSKLNRINIECVNMNLLDSFKPNSFDLILFNPPYVVTEAEEIVGNGLNRAWAGGRNGRVVVDKLLCNLNSLLTDQGVCYMVLLKENRPMEIVDMLKNFHFSSRMVLERKIPGEHLFVYKFFRDTI